MVYSIAEQRVPSLSEATLSLGGIVTHTAASKTALSDSCKPWCLACHLKHTGDKGVWQGVCGAGVNTSSGSRDCPITSFLQAGPLLVFGLSVKQAAQGRMELLRC